MVSQGRLDHSVVTPIALWPQNCSHSYTPLSPNFVDSPERTLSRPPKEYSSVFSPVSWLTPYLKYPLAPKIPPEFPKLLFI